MDIELKDILIIDDDDIMTIATQSFYLNITNRYLWFSFWPNNNGCRAGQTTIWENPEIRQNNIFVMNVWRSSADNRYQFYIRNISE